MMAEGDGEVKRETVEAGAGGAGGRPTGAREPAGEEVAQQGPAAAEPRRYLEHGDARSGLGRYEEAVADYDRAIRLDPENVAAPGVPVDPGGSGGSPC